MFNAQYSKAGSCVLHFVVLTSYLVLASCSVQKQITKSANKNVLNAPALHTAHVGISMYEPATHKYWYDYQGDKYFVPASNTKIPTCYAAMKYLGDSLVGLKYVETDSSIIVEGTGDPSFLHADFRHHNVLDFINSVNKKVELIYNRWQFKPLGNGWSWNDFSEPYMAERSEFPAYGNVVKINLDSGKLKVYPSQHNIILFPLIDSLKQMFELKRVKGDNIIHVIPSNQKFSETIIPLTNVEISQRSILFDAFKRVFAISKLKSLPNESKSIHSQPTDSLLKAMMHRSDNFFAEQSLLMVSHERLGMMNDAKIIDTLLKTDFKDLPQRPRWADGSGLSRYNLFTPQDFVFILNKMKNEFGMTRLKVILPTGGEGTLNNYYKADSSYIYAKTGSLSGVIAISGYLYTKKGKLLIFSVLVNNHQASATEVRRAVEKFIQQVRRD